MSYRLINSNALAIRCKEVNDLPCIYADLPNGLDGGHYTMTGSGGLMAKEGQTNYERYFGSPERAARTLHHGGTLVCRECLIREECAETPEDGNCMITDYDALLGWLRGDV